MDEETIRKRCIELTAGWLLDQGLVGLVHSVYRAAYADGLEKAAKIIQEGRFMQDAQAVSAIRQHAKEMGHE